MRSSPRTVNIVFDVANEQMFCSTETNAYILALIAWLMFRITPSAKFYGVDQWVEEIVHDHQKLYPLIDPNGLRQTTYIYFQLDTLLMPYDDWLVIDVDYHFTDDTFIITLTGHPGERYVRQPLYLEHSR